MNDLVLSLQNVAVAYSRRSFSLLRRNRTIWALENVSMQIRAGETVGVIGRNGAGKSTLLKVLAGIIDPDRGTVERAPGRASLLSLQVGFLGHLSGRENAVLSGMLLGLSMQRVRRLLPDIEEFSELGPAMNDPIATYSSGMKARLGFAVAYFAAPEILLIDEVLGVGDASFRRKSSEAIKQLIRSDRTVVLVSHQPTTIRDLCHSAVWIDQGVTRAAGAVDSVMAAYEQEIMRPRQEPPQTVSAG